MELKETLLIFIEIIIQSQDAGLRQTSAVVIRRFLPRPDKKTRKLNCGANKDIFITSAAKRTSKNYSKSYCQPCSRNSKK